MNKRLYDLLWAILEVIVFIALAPIWIPLLLLSLGYSLFCPYAYKPEKEEERR
jgi:hypothetical protein